MSQRRLVIVALFLAISIALGIGATPAAAAGCDCHTAIPPTGGAPAAHAAFVSGVTDCTTCHAGWTEPHPSAVAAALTVRANWMPALTGPPAGGWIGGRHSAQGAPVIGVVYGQKRQWGETVWVDVKAGGNVKDTAVYAAGSLEWPRDRWACVRAVAAGAEGSPAVLPVSAVSRPTPELGLTLDGVKRGLVTSRGVVKVRGDARPVKLSGERVRVVVFELDRGSWVQTGARSVMLRGTCKYQWRVAVMRGSYRIRATIAGTEDHRAVTTSWRYLRRR
jgi:hypothetical protein